MEHPRCGLAAASPSRGQHQRTGRAGSAVFAGVRLIVVACGRIFLAVVATASLSAFAADGWHGRDAPADLGGELSLIDQHGAPFALTRLAGTPVLLFFGFTHCSSTCPLALGEARQVLRTLGPQAAVVFVTLDPLSDGPQQMREFVQRIDTRLIGLTGSPLQIERVVERYGVGVRGNNGRVEHSSMWYLLDGQARVRRVYAHTTPAAELVADLRRLRP
jgi:protein SCO1